MRLLASLITAMFFCSAVILIVLACVIGRMRVFQKAGVAGWKSLIPLYRDWVLCEITMGKGWYFLFGLVPILAPVMRVLYAVEVTLSFRQEILFAVLYFFFPWACELYLGFGNVSYAGSQDLEQQIKNVFNGGKRYATAKRGDSYREVSPEEAKAAQNYAEKEQAGTASQTESQTESKTETETKP